MQSLDTCSYWSICSEVSVSLLRQSVTPTVDIFLKFTTIGMCGNLIGIYIWYIYITMVICLILVNLFPSRSSIWAYVCTIVTYVC